MSVTTGRVWRSMREFVEALEKEGELTRVSAEVDPAWEISSVTRQIFDWPEEQRPALMFDNIKGHQAPLVVALYANRRRYAKAMGCSIEQIVPTWKRALANEMPPNLVPSGPCQENVFVGEESNLFSLPVPVWSPGEGKDPGPYLTAPCVFTKDPETGAVNIGTYRCQLQGPRQIGINIHRERHGGFNLTKWEERGQDMDVAICLGPDPAVTLSSVAEAAYGKDELGIAGGLIGTGIDVVKCLTVDLEVPASSEIVIEGKIPPHTNVTEGPFGEMSGYLGLQKQSPLFRVTAITYRNDYFLHAYISQRPPSESSMLRKALYEPILLERLREMGIPGIKDLCVTEPACSAFHLVISIEQMYPAHAREVMLAAWAAGRCNYRQIVVVDDDIDPHNPVEVEWAIATRCRPDKDIMIIPEHVTSLIDPIQPPDQQRNQIGGTCAKYGLDATRSHTYSLIALPDRHYLERAKSNWSRYQIKPLLAK